MLKMPAFPHPCGLLSFAMLAARAVCLNSHVQQRAEDPCGVGMSGPRRYVNNMQMGEDDERPNGHASQAEEPDIDADTMALGLWRTVGRLAVALVCANALHTVPRPLLLSLLRSAAQWDHCAAVRR